MKAVSQEAVHGVTIRNSHLAKLVSSNHSGRFVIDAHIGDTPRIGYMGYLPKVFIVGNQSSSVNSLISNQQSLNEVVVTVLGIKKRKAGYWQFGAGNKR